MPCKMKYRSSTIVKYLSWKFMWKVNIIFIKTNKRQLFAMAIANLPCSCVGNVSVWIFVSTTTQKGPAKFGYSSSYVTMAPIPMTSPVMLCIDAKPPLILTINTKCAPIENHVTFPRHQLHTLNMTPVSYCFQASVNFTLASCKLDEYPWTIWNTWTGPYHPEKKKKKSGHGGIYFYILLNSGISLVWDPGNGVFFSQCGRVFFSQCRYIFVSFWTSISSERDCDYSFCLHMYAMSWCMCTWYVVSFANLITVSTRAVNLWELLGVRN